MAEVFFNDSDKRGFAFLLDRVLKSSGKKDEPQIILSPEAFPDCDAISGFLGDYGPSVYLDQHSFALLINPNYYSYRFLDTFQSQFSFFDFFDGNSVDIKTAKKDSRAVFEDCVFLFHFGSIDKAYAGFRNLERFGTGDRAVSIYRDRCEKVLYSKP